MKVLVFSNQGLSVPNLGMELEVIKNFSGEKVHVEIVTCNNVLSSCYFNPCHNLVACAMCESRTRAYHHENGFPADCIHQLQEYPEAQSFAVPFFSTLEELFDFEYNGVNIGVGVASSIISLKRDYEVSSHSHLDLIELNVRMALNVLLNFQDYVAKVQPDEIYLFNGRFAEVHVIVELAKKLGIPYRTLERGANFSTYDIYHDSLPHSIATREKYMDMYWAKEDPEEGEQKAINWFKKRRKGTNKNVVSFVGHMKEQALPEGFDSSKINIALLNSSEDEFKAIREWQNTLYHHQNDAIRQIVEGFLTEPNVHFYLRVHPNLGTVNNIQTREIAEMDYPNLTIIPPYSDVDTYFLIESTNKSIVFGSSTGVEATFWGKPSILYGKAFYMNLDCVYTPQSFEELCDLIKTKNLPPKDRTKAWKYAIYFISRGMQYKHFRWGGKANSYFLDRKMKRFYFPAVGIYFLKFLKKFSLWSKLTREYKGRGLQFSDLKELDAVHKQPK